MKKELIQTTVGDLIAALYDEAKVITRVKRFQTLFVALALLDIRARQRSRYCKAKRRRSAA